MSLHILNISVDAPDVKPDYIPEDLGYNDMESVVEIVLEQILGFEDAIPEQEDDDTSQGLLNHSFVPVFYQKQFNYSVLLHDNFIEKKHISFYKDKYFKQFQPEISTPPPKA
ncbi:hypothetical protein BWZ22_00320 [Seonamhaeicola sp. S2-3]|nr:hypothetical protein BWZ22_00320 [Seonamhaeicola sp. S2-3]